MSDPAGDSYSCHTDEYQPTSIAETERDPPKEGVISNVKRTRLVNQLAKPFEVIC